MSLHSMFSIFIICRFTSRAIHPNNYNITQLNLKKTEVTGMKKLIGNDINMMIAIT